MTDNMQEVYFDTIIMDLKAANAKEVYKKLSNHVSNLIGTAEKFLLDTIIENEENKNSGIGGGIAVVHARLPRLTRPIIIYSKIIDPIDFSAADGELVDIVTLVLSPEFEGSKHLQRLAMVTRFFNHEETRTALRNAEDFECVRTIVSEINERKKAA